MSARDTVHITAKQVSPWFLDMRQKDTAPLAGDVRGKSRKTNGERKSTTERGYSTQPDRQSMLLIFSHCKTPLLSE